MREDEDFLSFVCSSSGADVLKTLAALPEKERRHGKAVSMLFRKAFLTWFADGDAEKPVIKDPDAVVVAFFATCSMTDLKSLRFVPHLKRVPLTEIFAALRPSWTQEFVEHMVDKNPHAIASLAPLWKAGLCERPKGDALILGYYEYAVWRTSALEERNLLERDVWRFFEVGGGGEYSLANHDKFAKSATWSNRLLKYSASGRLDRQRLLDASLDALERDFSQYIAGWYSRFHSALQPTNEEQRDRARRYLTLLSSAIPPTVSFAMKHVQALEKESALDPLDLLEALNPVLQARAKGTVMAALKLAERVAKKDAALAGRAMSKAVLALVSEDAGVQSKALDLIEAFGGAEDEAVRSDLAVYVDLLAPSLRERAARLAGARTPVDTASALAPAPEAAQPVEPVANTAAAISLFLQVLEDARDPFAVERAIDGIARFGAELADNEIAISPLRKRAGQILKLPATTGLRMVLAETGRALASPDAPMATPEELGQGKLDPVGAQAVHLARNAEILRHVAGGYRLPMLSLPCDSSGTVMVETLAGRLPEYRAAGVTPGITDLSLALMRLQSERRNGQAYDLSCEHETDRAFAYALGEEVAIGPNPSLWAAAWRARPGNAVDDRITALFKEDLPNCGAPARMHLEVDRKDSESGEFRWITVQVPTTPIMRTRKRILPALFFHQAKNAYFSELGSGHTFAEIAWASLIHPTDPEPFFREAILAQDTYQKLSDNPTRGYLEPFFRPGPNVGQMVAAVLVYYLGCEDASVRARAEDAVLAAFATDRLEEAAFGAALRTFILADALPTGRWTKSLKAIAAAGAEQQVRDAIGRVLDFSPEATPRDIGGLLELFFELCTSTGSLPEQAAILRCLWGIPGGGKVSKFRKKLLDLAEA
ncbi:DUF6493 family protein [Ovoidimarina sediminis]|uniref:DUF6493 family protein n=1 Tax=Ovoidimarina sediminis TaxID=3079856 RepID=UPI0029132F0B|nr:DUF6493 family protein [Rhodophyticola sp. MJ-SS7]MDU8946401.1 DUF6493 family protein [Rhodophyticola sp. MJ-SS7]